LRPPHPRGGLTCDSREGGPADGRGKSASDGIGKRNSGKEQIHRFASRPLWLNRPNRWLSGDMALCEYPGGTMRLSKYRYVAIKSEKVVPRYSSKTEAGLAIKELKIIKKEVRLEKRKLQNRRKQLNTRCSQKIRQYTSLVNKKKKDRGNSSEITAFKKRKKQQLALLREPIDFNQRKLEIIIAEIDGEILKIESHKLYM
jgi:hypothetical protein